MDLLREDYLLRAKVVDLLFGFRQFSFEEENSIVGSGLLPVGSLILMSRFFDVASRFLQYCICVFAFSQQRIAPAADLRIFCAQERHARLAFEQGIGCRVSAAAKNYSFC